MSSSELFQVGDNVLETVAKSLNYTSLVSLNDDVKKIKEWMKMQPHLPEIMEEKSIQNFLIMNKGSIERTKEKIDNYYSVRSHFPEIFDHVNPKLPYMKNLLETHYFLPLPKQSKEGYRVFMYKIRNKTLIESFEPIDMIRFLVNLQEIRLIEDVTCGDVFIFDGKDVSLPTLLKITPTILYKALVVVYRNVFSSPLKGVYLVNAPPFAEILMQLLKTILKPKLFDRIFIVPNIEALTEQFGDVIFPKEFGGSEKSLHELQKTMVQKFREYEDRFNELDNLRVNEELRPKELKNEGLFGLSGNFKKLEVD